MQTKRIYMNEVDSSPGGGSVPPVQPAPAAAPTAPEMPPLTIDAVKTHVADQLKAFQNEFFASARKAGLLEKPKNTETPAAAPAATVTGLTEADLDARLEQERVVTTARIENKLTESQVKRMRAALKAEKPGDVSTWTAEYLADMGLVRTNAEPQTTTTTQTVAVTPSAAPISDRGTPAPNGVTGWRYEIATNPMGMSASSRAAMNAELGEEKARKQRLDASRDQAQRMQVVIPRG
jgi:hypothetical protein